MNARDFFTLAVVIFVSTLAAILVWTLMIKGVVTQQLQTATAGNPLLGLLTGNKT